MCGRYVLGLRYGQVRQELQNLGISVYDYDYTAAAEDEPPPDDDQEPRHESHQYNEAHEANTPTGAASRNAPHDEEPRHSFRPSYNMAPRFRGLVLRGVSAENENDRQTRRGSADPPFAVQLQVMQWGLIPSWTKRRPDYASTLKTINCRADSLFAGGMWSSMRGPKRCVVVAQGFYEWRQVGPKDRVPHYIRRHDGRPLLLAGLWDAVDLDDSAGPTRTRQKRETYTYTIITTDANDDMRFLHTRMPVIFDAGSPELRMWLDPKRTEWSSELQSLLRPWPSKSTSGDASYLDIDVVGKEVNKVGHDSPSLIVPVASSENKANIANLFAPRQKGKKESVPRASPPAKSILPVAQSKRAADKTDDRADKGVVEEPASKKAKLHKPGVWSTRKSFKPIGETHKSPGKSPGKSRNVGPEITSYFRPKE